MAKFIRGEEYDDKRNPFEWRFAAGYEFLFRLPWPWRDIGFFKYRNFTWGRKRGSSWYTYHFRKLKFMIPHTGSGAWLTPPEYGYRPEWAIELVDLKPGVYGGRYVLRAEYREDRI